MHTELHVQTVCELVGHEDYYMQPEIISLLDPSGKNVVSANVLPAISGSYDRVMRDSDAAELKEAALNIFRYDCIKTTQIDSYSGTWHIYALSSVLRTRIRSVYPEKNQHTIRQKLNMLVQPRITDAQNVNRCITIMWTRTTPTLTPQSWSPNHFVLCIPKQIQPIFTGLSHMSHEASPSSMPSLSLRQVYLRETAFQNKPSTSKKKTKRFSQSRKTKCLTPLVASQPSPLTSSFTRIPSSTSQASQDNASLTTLSTTQPTTHSLFTPLSTPQTGQNHATCGVSPSPVQQDHVTHSLSLPQVMHFQLDPSDAIRIPSLSSQVNQDNASPISLTSLSSSQAIARHDSASRCLITPPSDSQMTQSRTTRSLLPVSVSQANLLDHVHMTVCLTHSLASKASQHPSLTPISTFQKAKWILSLSHPVQHHKIARTMQLALFLPFQLHKNGVSLPFRLHQ